VTFAWHQLWPHLSPHTPCNIPWSPLACPPPNQTTNHLPTPPALAQRCCHLVDYLQYLTKKFKWTMVTGPDIQWCTLQLPCNHFTPTELHFPNKFNHEWLPLQVSHHINSTSSDLTAPHICSTWKLPKTSISAPQMNDRTYGMTSNKDCKKLPSTQHPTTDTWPTFIWALHRMHQQSDLTATHHKPTCTTTYHPATNNARLEATVLWMLWHGMAETLLIT